MKKYSRLALLVSPLILIACGKKEPEAAPAPVVVEVPAPAPVAAPAPAAPAAEPAELTDAQRDQQRKQALLDFATREDKYMNDPRAQYGESVKVSTTFGDPKPSSSSMGSNAIGPVDGKEWTNGHQDIGFDWIEFGYARPVQATEVRLVINQGAQALTKVELQDTDGKWNTVWSGLSDTKNEAHGPRTWFVKSFDKTPYKVKAVKYTIANNVQTGYKEVDAAQLVGD